jgi:hypothetical protein
MTQPGASRLWGCYVGCFVSASVAVLGLTSAIELFYHHQLQSSVGQPLRWLGQLWATNQPMPWLLSALALGTGLVGWVFFKRRWSRVWHSPALKHSGALP